MRKIWYFKKPGAQACGPIDQGTLQRLAASGQIAPTDIVWKEGTELRVQARNVGGLDKFYGQKPPIQGKQVDITYAATVPPPIRGTGSQARTTVLSLVPTHLDPVACHRELVVAGKTLIMAVIITMISIIYHPIK